MPLTRRQTLAVALLPALPAAATPAAMAIAIRAFTGDAPLVDGRIEIEIAELVENGNTVPLRVTVPGPTSGPAAVRSVALFTERNPQPEVAVFHFSPRVPQARVDTRIRLATSQALVAVAKSADGRCWQRRVEVLVTLAACIE